MELRAPALRHAASRDWPRYSRRSIRALRSSRCPGHQLSVSMLRMLRIVCLDCLRASYAWHPPLSLCLLRKEGRRSSRPLLALTHWDSPRVADDCRSRTAALDRPGSSLVKPRCPRAWLCSVMPLNPLATPRETLSVAQFATRAPRVIRSLTSRPCALGSTPCARSWVCARNTSSPRASPTQARVLRSRSAFAGGPTALSCRRTASASIALHRRQRPGGARPPGRSRTADPLPVARAPTIRPQATAYVVPGPL